MYKHKVNNKTIFLIEIRDYWPLMLSDYLKSLSDKRYLLFHADNIDELKRKVGKELYLTSEDIGFCAFLEMDRDTMVLIDELPPTKTLLYPHIIGEVQKVAVKSCFEDFNLVLKGNERLKAIKYLIEAHIFGGIIGI